MRKSRKTIKQYFVADFETTSYNQYLLEGETRVFLYYIENIYQDDINNIGININEFYNYITSNKNNNKIKRIIFFHNLTFDIIFLEYFLNKIGIKNSNDKEVGTYSIIRDEFHNVYQLVLYHSNKLIIEFRDSLKLLQMSVKKLPNKRGIEKLGDFDYTKIRNEKSINDFSNREIEYVKNDVIKVKDVLKELLEDIGDYLTIASSSYNDWLKMFNEDNKYNYSNNFPTLNEEEKIIIRKAYNGGIVTLNPNYIGKIIKEPIITFDVNSLYPSQMRYKLLPYGKPSKINNENNLKFLKERNYNLFVFCVYVEKMEIKESYHPFISTSKNYTYGNKKAYPNKIEDYVFYWTNLDLENVIKYYDISYNILYEYSYGIKGKLGIFDKYIDKYMEMKKNASNEFERLFAKFRLNTLYGKFGTRTERLSYNTSYVDDELIFNLVNSDSKKEYYLPLAVFITAYARDVFINSMQKEKDSFIYGDTDSLHLLKSKFKNSINIDNKKLGYWKFEGESLKSLFISNKQYLKLINNKIERKIASLNSENHYLINFENMKKGYIVKNGKKMRKLVKGGYVIIETDFTFT